MQKKFLRSLKAAIAFTLCFSLSLPVMAASEKEEVQQNVAALQNEKAALQGRLADLQANKSDTESYITQLDAELKEVGDEIARIQGELDNTQGELEQTQADLNTAKDKEAEQYAALKARIKAMYEKGDTSLMEVFMKAEDLSTLLNAKEYISRISDYDTELLTNLNNTRKEIETLEARLQEKKNELEQLKTQEEAKQDELELVMNAKRTELEQLGASINEVTAAIYNTQAEIDNNNRILESIRQAEIRAAELQRQAELAKQQEAAKKESQPETTAPETSESTDGGQSETTAPETAAPESETTAPETTAPESETSAPETTAPESETTAPETSAPETEPETTAPETTAPETEPETTAPETEPEPETGSSSGSASTAGVATGSFIWPTTGGYISSGFGGRTSPTAGASSNHKGIDIANGQGSSIYAADGGVVATASYSTARGYYVVISHGNGLSTLYQHCSALYVTEGTAVSQGDIIAAVGSTGYSTGPHLHFEVWVNGVPVDPQNYL